ncbi:MAG: carbohydrate porin [Hoeflea sp.]|uniref:carbohydrate porin n=1 Tax=Hoeflea sp. TaxID=1940281 RepID=UPI003297D5BE
MRFRTLHLSQRGGLSYLLGTLMLVNAAALPAYGQSTNSPGATTEQSLEDLIERNEEFDTFGWPAKGRFNPFPEVLNRYEKLNRDLWNKYGFSFFLKPTVIAQASSRPDRNWTANYQHNILLYWRMLQNETLGTASIVANGLQIRQLTNTTGVDFTQSLGINFTSSDSVADSDSLKALYLRYDLPGGAANIRFGQHELAGIVGGCAYSCDDTSSFMSGPLSAYPASTLPGQGMGFAGGVELGGGVSLEAGIADARGNGHLNPGRPFDSGEWGYAAAAKLSNPFAATGDGQIKAAYYFVDETFKGTSKRQASTQGVNFIVEQDIGAFGVFARYGASWGRKGAVDHAAAGGVVWKEPFGNDEDWLGAGLGWVAPTAQNSNNEYVAETFYRLQLTPLVVATTGVMAIGNPSNISSDLEGVLNFRVQAFF